MVDPWVWGCVVDEDGFIIPIAKCTVKELRAEAEARQIVGAKDMKRPDLTSAIKVCGIGCHTYVLNMYLKSRQTEVPKFSLSDWDVRHSMCS